MLCAPFLFRAASTSPRLIVFDLKVPVAAWFHSTPLAYRRMPPKKKVEEKKTVLGRPGNNLKIGIVGLPNVGKSSLFNVMSQTQLANAANFPYATM